VSFLVIYILSYVIATHYGLLSDLHKKSIGYDAYTAISLSKKYFPDKKIIILGDSVARQIISKGLKDKIRVIDLTCNQAISLAGQYALLINALNANPQVEKVYLLYQIGCFGNNLDDIWTYNYFVKPFYLGNDGIFSAATHERIESKVFGPLYRFPIARILPCFESIDYTQKKSPVQYRPMLSPTSVEYIHLMQNLCRDRNIIFRIIPTPISLNAGGSFDSFERGLKDNNLTDTFTGYLDHMMVLSNDFFVDGVHFKDQYVKFVSEFSMNYVGLLNDFND
jgi:hypothetical protein